MRIFLTKTVFILCLTSLVTFFWPAASVAHDEELAPNIDGSIAISAKKDPLVDRRIYSREQSFLPKIAIDSKSGATAIIWSNYHHSNHKKQNVLIRFLIPKKSNAWKLKQTMVAGPGGDWGSIAFNHINERFLVVWDNFPWDGWETQESSKIQGKLYDAKGRQRSGIINYEDGEMPNENPIVVYNSVDNNFLLMWCRRSKYFSDEPKAGVMTAILDDYGLQITEARRIREEITYDIWRWPTWVIDGAFNKKIQIFMVLQLEPEPINENDVRGRYYIYKIGRNGSLYQKFLLNPFGDKYGWSPYGSITNPHSGKKTFHYVSWADNGYSRIRKFSSIGYPIKKATTLERAWSTAMAYSPERDIYILITDGEVRFLDSDLNQLGSSFNVFWSASHTVAWNPVMGKFIAVWVRHRNVNDIVMLTTIDPPDEN